MDPGALVRRPWWRGPAVLTFGPMLWLLVGILVTIPDLPKFGWPAVPATAHDCVAGWTGRGNSHHVVTCTVSWAAGYSTPVTYDFGSVFDGDRVVVRASGARAVDPGALNRELANVALAATVTVLVWLVVLTIALVRRRSRSPATDPGTGQPPDPGPARD